MTANIFWVTAAGIVAAMTGFWTGRMSLLAKSGHEKEENNAEQEPTEEYGKNGGWESPFSREKRVPLGWAIGSPAEGEVSTFSEGTRYGAVIKSSQGAVYAPASGKITRLYPGGNEMILSTDFGVELLLRVGSLIDELQEEYFRPRILQNEIVSKGRLLLEYDRESLLAEGGNADVSVSVEAAEDFRSITVTERNQVRVGEEILWVRDEARILP